MLVMMSWLLAEAELLTAPQTLAGIKLISHISANRFIRAVRVEGTTH